tara:strand:- start:4 stop:132 length:129 start_codon:yes stop_codon:yes gene_type:complete
MINLIKGYFKTLIFQNNTKGDETLAQGEPFVSLSLHGLKKIL